MSSWNFVGLNYPAWVDPPRFEELQAGPYLPSRLKGALENYHQVPSSSRVHLLERMQTLARLREVLDELSLAPQLQPLQIWLSRLAQGKAEFLGCLQQILEENWHEPARLAAYLDDRSGLLDQARLSLHLTRERYLFPERSVYWGNYAMECLDPCHRQLPDMYRVWQEGAQDTPYLLWLERYSSFQHERWVRYLSPAEQAGYEVKVVEGQVCKLSGRPLSCPERQHFLFVIDRDEKLYAARAEPQLCHASFTRGQAVLASGILQARQGTLTHLKFESGHYLSDPAAWWQAIELLEKQGLTWTQPLRITVYDRFRYISTKVQPTALGSQAALLAALGL